MFDNIFKKIGSNEYIKKGGFVVAESKDLSRLAISPTLADYKKNKSEYAIVDRDFYIFRFYESETTISERQRMTGLYYGFQELNHLNIIKTGKVNKRPLDRYTLLFDVWDRLESLHRRHPNHFDHKDGTVSCIVSFNKAGGYLSLRLYKPKDHGEINFIDHETMVECHKMFPYILGD